MHQARTVKDFEYFYEWPEGVPRNYDELIVQFGDYVARRVRHYNKVDRNFEDLLQDIWMRIINAQLLEKFVEGGATHLPDRMTAEEAIAYLGVTWEQWLEVVSAQGEQRWPVEPVRGDRLSREAVFLTGDVLDLDGVDPFDVRPNDRWRPQMTARGFKAYLTRAVHNHYANWCRTRNRKYKEGLLPPGTIVSTRPNAAGYRLGGEIEDYGSWESNLMALTLDDEEFLTMKFKIDAAFSKQGVDPASAAGVEVLDYLTDGYSLDEAFQVQKQAAERVLDRKKLTQPV